MHRWVTKLSELDEGARVEEELQPLARRQLPGLVLLGDALGAPAELRLALQRLEPLAQRVAVTVGRSVHGSFGFPVGPPV